MSQQEHVFAVVHRPKDGQAIAIGLAKYGADVALIDLDTERCTATKTSIEMLGRCATAYDCDLADATAVHNVVQRIVEDFPVIDILVNIAGITGRIPTDEISPEVVQHLTEVNYYGTF
jgi:NAD(P)-dependent dehydrogenase (short-subunit alcohol dehydrogenase family)